MRFAAVFEESDSESNQFAFQKLVQTNYIDIEKHSSQRIKFEFQKLFWANNPNQLPKNKLERVKIS